ncbi:AraC family transcriptional regulator [Agrobacterium tumefaciens]|uniref:AraC family transcriptional regulator n=1 Tax=Agrobacterium tumefaciens TaxID=358 RepID=UPI000DDBDD98|nr:AraC family transcriptional regulator [Agrobacterium tumefaciens]
MTVRLSDASVDLPIVGSVIEAIVERSYLCLQLDLDAAAQSAAPKSPNTKGMPVGIALNRVTPPLLDTSIRLARLLETPDDIEELAPLTTREILYRLLTGGSGTTPHQMAQADSVSARLPAPSFGSGRISGRPIRLSRPPP